MLQSQKKEKTPLHLRLTYEDWKNCFKDLTRGELGVLLAIRCLDPYGDRTLEIDCERLGEELSLHRTSVSRALESLSQKGFIQMEITKVKVKQKVSNRKLTLLQPNQSEPDGGENKSNHELEGEQESCAPMHTAVHPRTQQCAHAHSRASTHTAVRQCTNQPPEPLSSKDSESSHTLKTIQTSSDCVLTHTRAHTHAEENQENPEPDSTSSELVTPNENISQLSGENENLGGDKFSAAGTPPKNAPKNAPNPKNYQLPSKITEAVLHPQKMVSEERNIRPQIRRPKFLYPDGEWLDPQGRMNSDFIRWMSSRWKVKFPDNAERPTEEIMADVLAYFANQPEKVAIQWDAYCAIAHRKVENITQRALTGFTMNSVDAKEYAIAASAIPTSQADAATDFTPFSICDRSAGVQRALESSGLAPQQKLVMSEASKPELPDPWQEVGEENWGEIATAKRQEWENSRPPGAVNFSDAISGIPAEPTPFTREGFAIVDGQIEAVSNQGAYKIMFDYQTPVQEVKTPQDIADITPEQQATNCQKIAEMIKNLANKKSGKFAGKNWAEELSKEAKKAEKLLTKPQYQVNKDGYFIDEEGEW